MVDNSVAARWIKISDVLFFSIICLIMSLIFLLKIPPPPDVTTTKTFLHIWQDYEHVYFHTNKTIGTIEMITSRIFSVRVDWWIGGNWYGVEWRDWGRDGGGRNVADATDAFTSKDRTICWRRWRVESGGG